MKWMKAKNCGKDSRESRISVFTGKVGAWIRNVTATTAVQSVSSAMATDNAVAMENNSKYSFIGLAYISSPFFMIDKLRI